VPLPKQRHSKARGRRRRTHWKLAGLNLILCPQCKQPRISHRVCKVCGYYDGRQAIEIKAKKEKKKK